MIRNLLIVLTLLLSANTNAIGQDTETFFARANSFFRTFSANGRVDYAALKRDPTQLNDLMHMASEIRVSETNANMYKAFWINAYNLTVIKGIVNNYPVKSPLDVKGFFDTITYVVGGKSVTLNDIENSQLRAKFDEPRFHFVLVCGAKGCPPIISEAYLPDSLELQLENQTVKALNDDSFVKVSEGGVMLSEIFKWYREDFVKAGLTEIEFLNTYRKKKVSPTLEISYYPYNWNLNMK